MPLSQKQCEYLALAWQCMDTEPKIDYEKFRVIAGLASAHSARELMRVTKKKLREEYGAPLAANANHVGAGQGRAKSIASMTTAAATMTKVQKPRVVKSQARRPVAAEKARAGIKAEPFDVELWSSKPVRAANGERKSRGGDGSEQDEEVFRADSPMSNHHTTAPRGLIKSESGHGFDGSSDQSEAEYMAPFE